MMIYYNPLFEKIEEISNLDYELKFDGKIKVSSTRMEKTKNIVEISNLTYMNNTT